MPPNPALSQALAAYGASQRLNQRPADVLLLAHETLCRELWAAKGAYEQNRLDQMCRHTARCTQILFSLRAALEMGASGVDQARLADFYNNVLVNIINLLNRPSVSDSLQESIDRLRELCTEFQIATER